MASENQLTKGEVMTHKKPNFLLVVVDDMGYSDCEPFGGEISSPNLVQLADEGVRFRHFYTSS